MGFFKKPKYTTSKQKKRDIPAGLWRKCDGCENVLFQKALEEAMQVCPHCGYHFPIAHLERIRFLLDAGSFEERDAALESTDPLAFTGVSSYPEKLAQNRQKTGLTDAVVTGTGLIEGRRLALGVMDFAFLGASMGSVVGERVTRLIEHAIAERLPVVLICASGGARMYEGMLSLMQMAKTSGALAHLRRAGNPYIAVLTHPTMAGVMASFASLGDVILAEPGAMIGFAGERVIRETTQEELPAGFQTAEFLLACGLIDQIVPRHELRRRLAVLLGILGVHTVWREAPVPNREPVAGAVMASEPAATVVLGAPSAA